MSKTNKTAEVLEYMRTHKWITAVDAVSNFGAYRLSAIIFNLRKSGYDIESVIVDGTDRYGHTVRYARYVLHE